MCVEEKAEQSLCFFLRCEDAGHLETVIEAGGACRRLTSLNLSCNFLHKVRTLFSRPTTCLIQRGG
jgi:hypothetical protein